ncbi:MAG: ABC transporter permease [Lachnospiraceae bacterium]|nr:ABC transporter permease [Lachnospiraceae bacterium]
MEKIKISDSERLGKAKELLKVNGGTFAAFILLFIVSSFLSPRFCTVSNMMTILRTNACTALCAFGMTFVILTGNIDISIGSFMTLCGCLTSMLIALAGIGTFAAIGIALGVAIICGYVNGFLITVFKIPAFIATLATMNILRGSCYVMTNGKPVVFSKGLFTTIGGGYLGQVPLPAIYMIVAFVILWVVLNKTKFGKHVYAVGGNAVAARYSGINTRRTVILVYIISGILAACSGILLISRLGSGQPTIGDGAELDAIASCVVGGVSMSGGSGTLVGTLFGCLIIGIISNILNLVGVNSYIQLIVKGVIIVLSIYLDIARNSIAAGKK